MDKQGKQTKTTTLVFNGLNYALWNVRMKVYLQSQGVDVWKEVVNIYNVPTTPPIDQASKKLYEDNTKSMNAILSDLAETIFVKVMHCETVKEIWEKLKTIYEGYDKVKGAKLQTYRGQFEHLKMKEDKNIATYFLQVDEVVNIIRGLGKRLKDQLLFKRY